MSDRDGLLRPRIGRTCGPIGAPQTNASSGPSPSPFACVVVSLHRDAEVVAAADRLYEELKAPASSLLRRRVRATRREIQDAT